MRQSNLFSAILLASMLVASNAHADPVWDFEYEADALPDDALSIKIGGVPTTEFSTAAGPPTSQAAAGGEYNFSTLGTDNGWFLMTDMLDDASFTLNSDTGYTAEYRVKLNDVDTFGTTNATIFELDETRGDGGGGFIDRYVGLRLFRTEGGQNQANLLNFDGGSVLLDVGPGFNTYRITVLGTTVNLYVNGSPTLAGTISTGTFPLDGFRWGDATATTDADATVDYLRLFSGGAVPPVSAQPGDFDSDGDVDGADFVVWQTNFPTASGATLATGDADSDGDVDGADFVVWQTNFPFTPSPSVAPVPEPSTLTLTLIVLIAFGMVGRKTAKRLLTTRRAVLTAR